MPHCKAEEMISVSLAGDEYPGFEGSFDKGPTATIKMLKAYCDHL